MAQFTIALHELLEAGFDIGLKDYPIYKEELREPLNKLIVEHFYFREIGFETPQRFKFALNLKMKEIMPYYNQLIKSEEVEFNPLFNIDITETYEQTSSNKENTNVSNNKSSNSMDKNLSVFSDTPQSRITESQILDNEYASQTENGKSNSSSEERGNSVADSVGEGNTNYKKRTEGSSAGLPFSKAIKQWREIMLNINMEIIKELEPLFIQLWGKESLRW